MLELGRIAYTGAHADLNKKKKENKFPLQKHYNVCMQLKQFLERKKIKIGQNQNWQVRNGNRSISNKKKKKLTLFCTIDVSILVCFTSCDLFKFPLTPRLETTGIGELQTITH